ncbi:hypothetical protein C8J56DRAFT_395336 [Mycena floridula]|nr:hypothetical protein C8J56DRAFT_395336 [Mycena floridula]
MEVIAKIRRENGWDLDQATMESMAPMQENLNNALNALATELYSKPSHFIMEFVQNADDNAFAPNVEPTLKIMIRRDHIVIQSNETGFSQSNVRAICKIGASTKKTNKGPDGYIGEKGIGFKAVFKVADRVHISSNEYQFHLDKRVKLGMITPSWGYLAPTAEQGWTTFHLELAADSRDKALLESYSAHLCPSILLFLRKLRRIVVDVKLDTNIQRSISKADGESSHSCTLVTQTQTLDSISVDKQAYLTFRHRVNMPDEPKRRGIETSEVVLAFPLNDKGKPMISTSQEVHAFLPLRSYGFSFIVHADFLTSANREDILSELPWNIALRDGVATAFVKAITTLFNSSPNLRFIWPLFMPLNLTGFFRPVTTQIIVQLQSRAVVFTSTDQLALPSKCITVADMYCDDGEPLIHESNLDDLFYLHESYDVPVKEILSCVKVRAMTVEDLVNGLRGFKSKSDAWHEKVAQALLDSSSFHLGSLVSAIPLIPKTSGSWASGRETVNIYFSEPSSVIPNGLDLLFVIPAVVQSSNRYRLYRALGVKTPDNEAFAHRILEVHGKPERGLWAHDLIGHAKFLFLHIRQTGRKVDLTKLLVQNNEGKTSLARDVYFDRLSYRALFPPSTLTLHPDYFQCFPDDHHDSWIEWLSLNTNVTPRIIHGSMSSELRYALATASTRDKLALLRECWSEISAQLFDSQKKLVRMTLMDCTDNQTHKLETVYLKRANIVGFSGTNLPFLDVEDPEDPEWDFLAQLGVACDTKLPFFIRRLEDMQAEGSLDSKRILELYERIQGCCTVVDVKKIQTVFNSRPLIFIPASRPPSLGRWLALSDVVWSAPSSLTSVTRLEKFYQAQKALFCTCLGLQNARPEVMLTELQNRISRWKTLAITSAIEWDLLHRLTDIAKESGLAPKLAGMEIFPVLEPGTAMPSLTLGPVYLIDPALKLHPLFSNVVPFMTQYSHSYFIRHKSKLKPITMVFASQLKDIAKEVIKESKYIGGQQKELELQEMFASRSRFIQRLVNRAMPRKEAEVAPRAKRISERLPGIRISSVDRIETTYRLLGETRTTFDTFMLEVDQTETVNVICSLGSGGSLNLIGAEIAKALATVLHVEVNDFLNVIFLPLDALLLIHQMANLDHFDNLTVLPNAARQSLVKNTKSSAITSSRSSTATSSLIRQLQGRQPPRHLQPEQASEREVLSDLMSDLGSRMIPVTSVIPSVTLASDGLVSTPRSAATNRSPSLAPSTIASNSSTGNSI